MGYKRLTPATFTSLNAFVVVPYNPDTPYQQYREFTGGEVRAVRDRDGDALKALQGMVGGLIEPLYFYDADLDKEWTVYGNEEARIYGMEINAAATAMLGHVICGPVVFHPASWTQWGD